MRFCTAVLATVMVFSLSACENNPEGPGDETPTGRSIVYPLASIGTIGGASVSGTVTFTELRNQTTRVNIAVSGTPAGGSHPAHIHGNSINETGPVVLSFTPVTGGAGTSETIARRFDNGTPVTYDELINYDGYVFVHESAQNLGNVIAGGDIGGNQLTGVSQTYNLTAVNGSILNGQVIVRQRKNGNALVEVRVSGTATGVDHIVHLHTGNFDINNAPGSVPIKRTLRNIVGVSSAQVVTQTHVEVDDATQPFTYSQIVSGNWYLQIHQNTLGNSPAAAYAEVGS